jgi:hypothetical protein
MGTPKNSMQPTMLLSLNLIATIMLGIGLLCTLEVTQNKYIEAIKIEKSIKRLTNDLNLFKEKNDTLQVRKLEEQIKSEESSLESPETVVTFYDIVILMLIAGGLGGILCNLRGFFMQFRKDEGGLPIHLVIPYYVRPFMGAGAGLFIYFVTNFLITSITVTYVATSVPFQGMVTFIALAILAGFGSMEFFQRLKETALSLFGQKPERDKWEKIEDLYALMKKGVISETEYNAEKEKLLASSTDEEARSQKVLDLSGGQEIKKN